MTNGKAITSLIMGILAIILGWIPIIGLIFPILAIVFGVMALKQIKIEPQDGKGFAIAGIVMACISFIFVLMFTFIGVIAYFGVLSPAKFTPEMCTMSSGIACLDFVKSSNQITLTFQNSAGYDLEEIKFKLVGDKTFECTGPTKLTLGNKGNYICAGDIEASSGKFDIDMTYTNGATKLEHTKQGRLVVKV